MCVVCVVVVRKKKTFIQGPAAPASLCKKKKNAMLSLHANAKRMLLLACP